MLDATGIVIGSVLRAQCKWSRIYVDENKYLKHNHTVAVSDAVTIAPQ
jgi:hypothetical protein